MEYDVRPHGMEINKFGRISRSSHYWVKMHEHSNRARCAVRIALYYEQQCACELQRDNWRTAENCLYKARVATGEAREYAMLAVRYFGLWHDEMHWASGS